MTHFTIKNLNQKAIYWGSPVSDGYGNYNYTDPIEISCRWEDIGMVAEGPAGVNLELRSEVMIAQDVDREGMMKLGELVDLDSDEINDPVKAGADMIVRVDKIPSIKGTDYYRKVYLSKLWTGKT